jgi:transposase
VREVLPDNIDLKDVDIWFQDEARVGQQGSQTRIWAKTGTRPRVVKQQQFLCEYIFGAVCPTQKTCAAIVVPYANHESLEKHLEEISSHVPEGRHAVILMDRAGWHRSKELKVPKNIHLLYLPPYAPELNPQEQVWQHLKDRYLSNRTFESLEQIIEECCKAWNQFANNPALIGSLTHREWASVV